MISKTEIADHGFTIVAGALDEPELAAFTRRLEAALRSTKLAIRRRGDVYAVRNLLEVAPFASRLLRTPVLHQLIANVLDGEPRVVRALLFDKPPSANWAVPWHQDRTIAVEQRAEVAGFDAWTQKAGVLHVQPPAQILEAMLTVRVHLDHLAGDGALRVIRGSHIRGLISGEDVSRAVAAGELVTCEVPRGGALVMRPLLLHSSRATQSARHRRVVHLELAASDLPFPLRWKLNERLGSSRCYRPSGEL